MDFMDWDSYFIFSRKNLRLKFCVGDYDGIVLHLNFEVGCLADSMVGPDCAVLLP